jgi:two-component system OmpR family response regulator
MTHVLLIDDDAALSGMLTEYLAREGFETTAAFNGENGMEIVAANRFDAVILDVMLPSMNGIEVLRRIRQASDIPVIMLTAKGDDIDRVVGLEMGADDYVAKPYHARELVARLRAVLRRQSANLRETLTIGLIQLCPLKREAQFSGQPLDLTLSEFDLLEALMRAREAVATKDDLSITVLGRKRQPYDRSVDVHVSNLRRKLAGVSDGKVEIETVRGVGYRIRTQT